MTTTALSPSDRPQVIDDWFLLPAPAPAARTRLFCFPHAGGDATAFAPLARELAPETEVWGLRLPGRGARLREPLPADFDQLVHLVVGALLSHTHPGVTFGLYGQSFGALLAYEVARALPPGHRPRFLVPASAHAPQRWAEELPEELDAATLLAATDPDGIIEQSAELKALTLAVTGADLALCRSYRHRPGTLPPEVRLHAVVGAADPLVGGQDLAAWAAVTESGVETMVIEGGHLLAVPTAPGPVDLLRAVAGEAAVAPVAHTAPIAAADTDQVLDVDLDLSDTTFWEGPDVAARIDALRAAAPVRRTTVAGDGPIWSVLSYQHAAQVLGEAENFSSLGGSLLGTSPDGSVPAGSGKMMAFCDPPVHRTIRTPLTPFFNARNTASYAPRLTQLAEQAVRSGLEQGEVNFVDVIAPVPLAVMCDLLDIPMADREKVVALSDRAFLGTTAEARRAGHQELIRYLFTHTITHRARPAEDLVSVLATHRMDGSLLPIEDVVLNLDNILVGGVQTVRHTAAMGMLALLRNPRQLQALWEGEIEPVDAVDELLRWTSSGLHVLRTAARDVTLGGAEIRAGEKVVVWTWAANHDPAQFERPEELLLDRTRGRHLGLGWGPHFCLGAALAKAELAAIFRALRDQVRSIELIGTPRHNKSIINFGLDELPVRLVAR
ncbi:cytochrome P450 [Kitasatospora kifunensis]|uniref:Cytochrome P450/surfactin synthase thioesterase subunit n=1 Tax=Kitasatospora kifunensis TaxID=58351 RepID=A0A7W7QX96_KITKI|nr:cytochrome P450 [Kitasatospora kifunensis]MBB4921452.1 cytochrome P450/surfactin synthase thioesterase subunit [Kitasatospora kifunensis]